MYFCLHEKGNNVISLFSCFKLYFIYIYFWQPSELSASGGIKCCYLMAPLLCLLRFCVVWRVTVFMVRTGCYVITERAGIYSTE